MFHANALDRKGSNTLAGAEMNSKILVGNLVRLLAIPEWMTHDLPVSEQIEMRACIGQIAVVQEIDSYGYIWIGFGATVENEGDLQYGGHSLGVPSECVELIFPVLD